MPARNGNGERGFGSSNIPRNRRNERDERTVEMKGIAQAAILLNEPDMIFGKTRTSPNVTSCKRLVASDTAASVPHIRSRPAMLEKVVDSRSKSVLDVTPPTEWEIEATCQPKVISVEFID